MEMAKHAFNSNSSASAAPFNLERMSRGSMANDYPRKSEESIYFSSTSTLHSALEAPAAIPIFSAPGSRLSTESRSRRRRSGSGSMIVMAAADPGILVKPPMIGENKLEHDRARRLGVANDLEAVIAVSEVNLRQSVRVTREVGRDTLVAMRI